MIAREVGVAKSSVSLWVRDVPLSEAQQAALAEADPVRRRRRTGNLAWSRQCRDARRRAQAHGRELARRDDPLHRAGCMLYWAEGGKARNAVGFTNSDVEMLRFFVRFLRECYGVPDGRIRLTVNCFLGNGLELDEIEDFWLDRLELPRSSLRPSIVNRPSRASKGVHRPLPHGTAKIVVHSTEIVQSIYGAIQEYAGFDRPEWLDLDHPSRPVLRHEPAATTDA
jgi:hypothetical protein